MAERIDFEVDRGATWSQAMQYNDADGNPIDLTGYTATLEVCDQTITLSVTNTGGLTLYMQDTSNLKGGGYKLTLTNPSGDITRLLQGEVLVND